MKNKTIKRNVNEYCIFYKKYEKNSKDEPLLHRDKGPSIICFQGCIHWYKNGVLDIRKQFTFLNRNLKVIGKAYKSKLFPNKWEYVSYDEKKHGVVNTKRLAWDKLNEYSDICQ